MPAKKVLPLCPTCDTPMVKRNGPRGPFWGCSKFPACRGSRDIEGKSTAPPAPNASAPSPASKARPAPLSVRVYEPIPILAGSEEQEEIWAAMLNDTCHMVLNCGPGTGKTFTILQGCLRLPRTRILVVAFNKHIAVEAGGKLRASGCYNVKASTFHSVGYNMLRALFPNLGDPDDSKMRRIMEYLSPEPAFNKADWRRTLHLAEKLSGFAKNYLLNYQADDFAEQLEKLADHHNLETHGLLSQAIQLVRPALECCLDQASTVICFDDMLWLPVILNLKTPEPYDMVMVDESQDLSPVQHAMALQLARTERLVIVGDIRQSIYGWRGASTQSIEALTETLSKTPRGVKLFPLTITRRCPKANVGMAQAVFPEIRAMDDAPQGEVKVLPEYSAIDMMQPGDLVLCRVNAKLVPAAYALLRRGVKAIIRGRNIGEGLMDLITTLEKRIERDPSLKNCIHCGKPRFFHGRFARCDDDQTQYEEPKVGMPHFSAALRNYLHDEAAKLIPLGDSALGRLTALREKCECLIEMIVEVESVTELRTKIDRLFADFDPDGKPNDAVVLGTIHRTKGLEATRVFVLAPELIPHPMARVPWEREQEKHCAWIAITRTKFDVKNNAPGLTVFCGMIPDIYIARKEVASETSPHNREEVA